MLNPMINHNAIEQQPFLDLDIEILNSSRLIPRVEEDEIDTMPLAEFQFFLSVTTHLEDENTR